MKRETVCIDFGLWMRKKRKERKLTQEALAKRMNCHATSIQRWESGDQQPRIDDAEKLVELLGAELVIREYD